MSQQTIIDVIKNDSDLEINHENVEITYPTKSTIIVKPSDIDEIDISLGGQYVVCRFSTKNKDIKMSQKDGITFFDM